MNQLPGVINNLDPPPVQLSVIQLVNCFLHVIIAGELHNSLVLARLVSVGVGDLPRAPHEVLQVLPADPAGEVLHDDAVLGPGGRAVLVQPDRSPAVPPVPAPTPTARPPATAACPAVLVPAVRSALGQLQRHSLTEEIRAVQVIHGVVSIAVVLELNEGVPDIKMLLSSHVKHDMTRHVGELLTCS